MSDEILARHVAAETIAAEAAALALDYFHRQADLVIETKSSLQDVVSQADREVEDLIRARILAQFPEDGLLGEEHGVRAGTSGYTWVIDPIDGTSPYLAGLPHWCVAIAVVRGQDTVAAVTHVPMAGEVFSARLGGGAWLSGVPMRLDTSSRLQKALIGIGASHRSDPAHVAHVIAGVLRAGGAFYRNGSGALMLASVAAGRLGGYYEPHMNCWDCLGGMLMIREAGGLTRDFGTMDVLEGGLVLTAAAGVYDDLARIVLPG